jgi:hypothetical protein
MSLIFDRLEEHAGNLQSILNSRLLRSDETHDFPWDNLVYNGKGSRRAHIDIVDKRKEKKLYMMHLCVFPSIYSSAPIYGFDLIAGPNKVTGAFHDFSPIKCDHPLNDIFYNRVKGYSWSKKRELPEWAKAIFSENMVSAGNIRDSKELDEVLNLSVCNLLEYLDYLEGETEIVSSAEQLKIITDYTEAQNRYCHFQKQNPHTPRVMESLGYDPDTVNRFIQTCLFPEI